MSQTPSPSADTPPPVPTPRPAASDWGRSARETIESIAIAFALAFLFKTFEAEAFVIPTGSMAPTLMGRHKDVNCPQCGYRYSASASEEADRQGNERRAPNGELDAHWQVISCTCPICRFPMSVDPQDPAVDRTANKSYSGDRIWVSKVPYQFSEPRRWDVIVFRFPQEAETYYIKRLVGLPGEKLKILHGDIYTQRAGESDFQLARKPADKVRAMAQVVHDNDYQSPELIKADWPARWRMWSAEDAPGAWQLSDDMKIYTTDGKNEDETWIRYEHLVPSEQFWRDRYDGRTELVREPRPQLITDYYAFNTRVLRQEYGSMPSMLGLHWVGDLILECTLDVKSDQGQIMADLVKGGKHFRATFDVATGTVELSIDSLPNWKRTGQTALRGPGKHQLMFGNVDRQLFLWVDDHLVEFNEPAVYDDLDNDRPQTDEKTGGDLAPLGIGSRGAAVEVSHLRVLRDIYYIADRSGVLPITDFRDPSSTLPLLRTDELVEFLSSPGEWQRRRGGSVFDDRQEVTFELEPDQFFVLGDNSPFSSDARFWLGQNFVDRSLLVGKALFIYWPHPLNLPIPMTNYSLPVVPNVPDMGFIR